MNQKQKKFCEHYVENGNAYEAAIEAGYSINTARANSYKLLDNIGCKKYIDELNEKISNDKIMSAKEIQERLSAMGRGELQEECITVVSDGDYCTRVEKTKKQITPKDQKAAIETLAKIKRLFNEGVDVTIQVPQIVDDI